ncbi:pro-resilin [Halyomorpha halys]|uniref:pro-resilin n=1 Tax=Halyomorpha halys TaxID=286706 RepID=UPI0006D50B21|nr:uncharacterized protein LOC106692527 [Halyomorpha halys]
MKMIDYTNVFILITIAAVISGAPQDLVTEKPMPYQYDYKVQDAEKSLYFGAQEAGNEVGRVEGSYQVLLPDGKLMTVTYYIEGESGFVPKISFQENANPFGSARK